MQVKVNVITIRKYRKPIRVSYNRGYDKNIKIVELNDRFVYEMNITLNGKTFLVKNVILDFSTKEVLDFYPINGFDPDIYYGIKKALKKFVDIDNPYIDEVFFFF